MGTAPGEEQPASRGRGGDPVQLRLEIVPGLVDAPTDIGADLDAACVELTLNRVGQGRGKFGDDPIDPVPEGQCVRVDELELQLDADGRRGAGVKRMIEHGEALDPLDCVGSTPRRPSAKRCLGRAARTIAGRPGRHRTNDQRDGKRCAVGGKCGKAAGSGDVGGSSEPETRSQELVRNRWMNPRIRSSQHARPRDRDAYRRRSPVRFGDHRPAACSSLSSRIAASTSSSPEPSAQRALTTS